MRRRPGELVELLRAAVHPALVMHEASSQAAMRQAERVALDQLRAGHSFDDAFHSARHAFYDALYQEPVRLRAVSMGTKDAGVAAAGCLCTVCNSKVDASTAVVSCPVCGSPVIPATSQPGATAGTDQAGLPGSELYLG